MIFKSFQILVIILLPCMVFAQQRISMEQAVQQAINNHPAIKAADLQVEQQRALQRTSVNIANPEIEYEKEKNTAFGLGIRQSFSFPTVYGAQLKLQRERTGLALAQKNITLNDLRRSVREQYTQAQYFGALADEYQVQDSTYQRFANAAKRQFEAGQIDFLQQTFAEAKASEIRNIYQKTQIDFQFALERLRTLMGSPEKIPVDPLTKSSPVMFADTSSVINPSVAYFSQQAHVEQRNLRLQRNKVLPEFFVGYQKNNPFNQNAFSRFRAGFTIPLWFWQYSGFIKSANAGFEAAKQQTLAQKVTVNADVQQAFGAAQSNLQLVDFYEQTGLKQAETIVNTASRLFVSGENDYVNFIRNLADAYAIRLRYVESLREYNSAVNTINFIIGK